MNIYQIPVQRGLNVTLFHAEEALVPIRPICELLGLNWPTQYAKLMASPDRWGVVIIPTPSAGGEQETTCLPARQVVAWLWTISASKVVPAAVEKLLILRQRLDQTLEAHARERVADLKRRVAVLTGEVIGRKPSWGRLKAWADAGLTDTEILRQSSMPRWRTQEDLATLRAAGLIGDPAEDLTPMERLMGADDHV